MKKIFALAATLAAGIALAPMAANAAAITFDVGWDRISFAGGTPSGVMNAGSPIGLNTPRNAGERVACEGCGVQFSDKVEIFRPLDQTLDMVLTGTFAEPVKFTLNVWDSPSEAYGDWSFEGALRNVVIDEDFAAYYGVPNWGAGEVILTGSGRHTQDGPGLSDLDSYGTVTFHPVPVPAALPLMLTALAGLGLIEWRRRRAAA